MTNSGSGRRVRHVHVPGGVPPTVPQPFQPPSPPAPMPVFSPAPNVPQPTPAPDARQVENVAETTQKQIAELLIRTNSLGKKLHELAAAEEERTTTENRRVRQEVDQRRQALRRRVETSFDDRLKSATEVFTQAVEEVAPEAASIDLNNLDQAPVPSKVSQFVRVGSVSFGTGKVAALAPFLGKENWLIEGTARPARELMLSVLARTAAAVPVKHLRILVFDPRITGDLGALSPLRSYWGATFPPAFADPSSFRDALISAMTSAGENAEQMAIHGAKDIVDLWSKLDTPTGVATVVAVLDHPYGINDELRKTLEHISASGPATGVTLMIQSDPALNVSIRSEWQATLNRMFRLRYEDQRWEHPGFPSGLNQSSSVSVVRHDGAPDGPRLNNLLERIGKASTTTEGPKYPLSDLIASALENPWTKSSADSLDAIVGKTGKQDLVISFRSENPPHPNLLIGGAVGQGKSNLLLDIIYALATDYSPGELELHLLDFKRGLEFKRFDKNEDGQGWLPHAKVLSLESNQEFGLAILRNVEAELGRRAVLFKQAGANSITEYRRITGLALPRLLLIIDEFHVLFEGEDALVESAVELLEVLAKQGRAYGVHLLLSSQTTSGISGLRVKGDSIFAQFPLRMSLKNTSQESEAILSAQNRAAADLTYRGEVIYNQNFGQDPAGSNVRGIAAWVDPEKFTAVQNRLWERGHGESPMVFIGSDYAQWDEAQLRALAPRRDGITTFWAGRPIEITNAPKIVELDTDTSQGIALVGTGEEVALAFLESGILSTLLTMGDQAELVFLCGLNAMPEGMQTLAARLTSLGRRVTIVDRRDIPAYLVNDVCPLLSSNEEHPQLIVGLAVQRVPGMEAMIEKDAFGNDPDEFVPFDFLAPGLDTGQDVLRALVASGGLQKIFFVGWWSSLHGLTNSLGFGHPGIGTYALAKVGVDDVREIAGPTAKPIAASPRIGIYQRNEDDGLVAVVPFAPCPVAYWDRTIREVSNG